MGTRGPTAARGFLMGSVSSRISVQSMMRVMVVPWEAYASESTPRARRSLPTMLPMDRPHFLLMNESLPPGPGHHNTPSIRHPH